MYRETYLGRRLLWVMGGFSLAMMVVLLQILHVQIFMARAETRPYAASSTLLHPMGTIVDRSGYPLAYDVPEYELTVDGSVITTERQLASMRLWLTQLGFEPGQVDATMQAVLHSQRATLKPLTDEQAQAVRARIAQARAEGRQPAVRLDVRWRRHYPHGYVAAHVLGFRNLSVPPRTQGGVHQVYQTFLETGRNLRPEHAHEADVPGGETPFFPSPFRRDLMLTLHLGVQYRVERELDRAIDRYEAVGGVAIVMDPNDGSIIALASRPTFDPNRFYEYGADTWRDLAVEAHYEPGSVMKALTFAAAYDTGTIDENTRIEDKGALTYEGEVIYNSQRRAFGLVTPAEALAHSLNVVTAQVALWLGPAQFYQYLDAFGIGHKTEVDLANETEGIVHEPNKPDWSPFYLATNSFGQGISIPPIQLIRAMAVLANGGHQVRPHVLQGYYLKDTFYEVRWPRGRQVIRPETAQVVTHWLEGVVDVIKVYGQVRGIRVAGKTGTAQVPIPGGYSTDEQNTFFVGYYPAENPRLIILVFLEKPKKGPAIHGGGHADAWASNTAYPTFVRIADAINPILGIRPEESDGERGHVLARQGE